MEFMLTVINPNVSPTKMLLTRRFEITSSGLASFRENAKSLICTKNNKDPNVDSCRTRHEIIYTP